MQSPKIIAILDTETTGLRPPGGPTAVGIVVTRVHDWMPSEILSEYAALNYPGCSIPQAIQDLTGITDQMVQGKSFDFNVMSAMLKPVDFIVAHNASFDRMWLDHVGFRPEARWLCSKTFMDWSGIHECSKLQCLALKFRCESDVKHNALADAHVLLKVLQHSSALKTMVESYHIPRRILRATGAPFQSKDMLREAGFMWSAVAKVWWRPITPDQEDSMRELFSRVYTGRAPWPVSKEVDITDPQALVDLGLEAA